MGLDLSAIQAVEINNPDFAGKKFAVIQNEQVNTGAGVLNSAMMALPELLLDLFGTAATFYLGGVSEYNPDTGEVTVVGGTTLTVKCYPEAYTIEEVSNLAELKSGDIKLYVPGATFGYETIALLMLTIREVGSETEIINVS